MANPEARYALKAGVPSRSGSLPRGWRSLSVPCSTHRGSWGSVLLEGGRLAGLDGLAGPLWDRELLLLLLTGELLASRLGGLLGGRLAGLRGCLMGTMSLFLLPDGLGLGSLRHHHLEPLPHEPPRRLVWGAVGAAAALAMSEIPASIALDSSDLCSRTCSNSPSSGFLHALPPFLPFCGSRLPVAVALAAVEVVEAVVVVVVLVASQVESSRLPSVSLPESTTSAVAAAEPAAWTALLIWKDKK